MLFSPPYIEFDPQTGQVPGLPARPRRLSQLKDCFADHKAYAEALAKDDVLVYAVTSLEPENGAGQLHYGLGILLPGQIGREYFMTKGHFHAWRPAAEVYLGLRGQGLMLLENELTGERRVRSLHANSIVYVPGFTAHRTINTGAEPLVYWGIYPAEAGHDYAPIARRNFEDVVVNIDGHPAVMAREAYLQSMKGALA